MWFCRFFVSFHCDIESSITISQWRDSLKNNTLKWKNGSLSEVNALRNLGHSTKTLHTSSEFRVHQDVMLMHVHSIHKRLVLNIVRISVSFDRNFSTKKTIEFEKDLQVVVTIQKILVTNYILRRYKHILDQDYMQLCTILPR
jgi:adenosine deaminase